MSDYIDTIESNPKGEVSLRNDELVIRSKTQPDGQTGCAGLGFDSENGAIGKFSWRQNGVERLLMVGSLDDGFTFQQNPTGVSDDSAMKKVLEVRHDRILSHVPIEAPGLNSSGGNQTKELSSPSDLFRATLHDDNGVFAIYQRIGDSWDNGSKLFAVVNTTRVK